MAERIGNAFLERWEELLRLGQEQKRANASNDDAYDSNDAFRSSTWTYSSLVDSSNIQARSSSSAHSNTVEMAQWR